MLPYLSIHSQSAKIGIRSEPMRFEISNRPPDVHVESKPAQVSAQLGAGELVIDQSRTWDALNGGKPEVFWRRINAQYVQAARQNIARIVEEGNRMGDLRVKGYPPSDIALSKLIEGGPDLEVYGFASSDNIDFQYVPKDPDIQVTPGERQVDVEIHRPEIQFQRGNVSIYMERYPTMSIQVMNLDIRV